MTRHLLAHLLSHLLPVAAVAALLAGVTDGAHSASPAVAAVGEALDRPALGVRDPSHAVVLAAAQAGPRLVAVGERGLVLGSDDGGRTWRQSAVPVSVTLTALGFADPQHGAHGYAVGHGGVVLVTADGGRTWTRRLDGRRLAELERQAAEAAGDAAAVKSAQQLVADGPDKPLLDVLVLDAQRAVAVGAYGIALATEDGGATWSSWRARLDNPRELHLYALRRRGDAIVIAGEQGLLLRSSDAGRSFVRLSAPYKGSFFTVEMPADGQIVAAGLRGNVWRSMDNGGTWTQVASPVPASVTASTRRADGSLVFANQAGLLLALTGTVPGAALQPLPVAELPPLNGVLALPDGALLASTLLGPRRVDAAGAATPAVSR